MREIEGCADHGPCMRDYRDGQKDLQESQQQSSQQSNCQNIIPNLHQKVQRKTREKGGLDTDFQKEQPHKRRKDLKGSKEGHNQL